MGRRKKIDPGGAGTALEQQADLMSPAEQREEFIANGHAVTVHPTENYRTASQGPSPGDGATLSVVGGSPQASENSPAQNVKAAAGCLTWALRHLALAGYTPTNNNGPLAQQAATLERIQGVLNGWTPPAFIKKVVRLPPIHLPPPPSPKGEFTPPPPLADSDPYRPCKKKGRPGRPGTQSPQEEEGEGEPAAPPPPVSEDKVEGARLKLLPLKVSRLRSLARDKGWTDLDKKELTKEQLLGGLARRLAAGDPPLTKVSQPLTGPSGIFGFPVTAVIRRLAKEGWDYKGVVSLLTTLKVHAAEATIRAQLHRGKHGLGGEPAALTKEQLGQLQLGDDTPV